MTKAKKVMLFIFELLLIMVVAFLCVVACVAFKTERNSALEQGFFKARNQETILELWHVETFEGGTTSREKYLEKRAIEFEKQNKGVFVLVKSVSLSELELSFKENKMPDLISFGYGVQNQFKDKLVALNLENSTFLKQSFYDSGLNGGRLLAVPYCYSRNLLFSTPEKLEKAGVNGSETLNNILFNAGYTIKTKKKTKVVYSCVYGGQNTPNLMLESAVQNAILPESATLSSFNAYLKFYGGGATILLGSLRDLARLENKLKSGEITKLLCEPYSNETSLTQNLGVFASSSSEKQRFSTMFIDYCLSPFAQAQVAGVGLLSPTQNIYSQNSALGQIEKQSQNITAAPLF